MKSLAIASLVSVLWVLWLPNHGVESAVVKVLQCTVDNPNEGILFFSDINVSEDKIKSTTLEFKEELTTGTTSVHMTIFNEDGDSLFDQTMDLCSMSSNDMFKDYFDSFQDENFNKGNCPVPMGTYSSSQFEINMDDGPEGTYKAVLEVMDSSKTLIHIECKAQMDK